MAEAAKIRRQAYVAPTASIRTDRSRKANTEAGLSEPQRKALNDWESKNANYRTERAAVVDENGRVNPNGNPMVSTDRYGRVVEVNNGSSNRVMLDRRRIPENSVLTHNHPSEGKSLAGRVGIPLSGDDLRTAVNNNLKEIRARTPNYVFSVKRPAGGWGISPSQMKSEYDAMWHGYARRESDYLRRTGRISNRADLDSYIDRINTLAAHKALKELAKKYGFSYTRRRT